MKNVYQWALLLLPRRDLRVGSANSSRARSRLEGMRFESNIKSLQGPHMASKRSNLPLQDAIQCSASLISLTFLIQSSLEGTLDCFQ